MYTPKEWQGSYAYLKACKSFPCGQGLNNSMSSLTGNYKSLNFTLKKHSFHKVFLLRIIAIHHQTHHWFVVCKRSLHLV